MSQCEYRFEGRLNPSRSQGQISSPHRFLTLRNIFLGRVSVMRSVYAIDFCAYGARPTASHEQVSSSFSAIHAARSLSTGAELKTQSTKSISSVVQSQAADYR